jgi:hypothetical protein
MLVGLMDFFYMDNGKGLGIIYSKRDLIEH